MELPWTQRTLEKEQILRGETKTLHFEYIKFEVSIKSQVIDWIYESGVQARDQGNSYKFGSHQHRYSRMVFKVLRSINNYVR